MKPKSVRSLVLLLLLALALFAGEPAHAQSPDLFFSEYVEGTSNNKALEIYNPAGEAVDLAAAGYNVQMYFNGSITAGTTIALTGSIAPGGFYVLAHGSATGAILAVANQTSSAPWFNGNDAVVLRKGTTVLDVIGQIGPPAPVTEWGTGLTSTADNTLRRKSWIAAGDTNGSDPFDPALEWDGFPTNTFDGLAGGVVEPPTPAEIFEIQGPGLTSPLANRMVRTAGNVVTAVGTGGFFIQMPAPAGDIDPAASRGVFVFTGAVPAVAVGDLVEVVGRVSEFFNMTEIDAESVTNTPGGTLPPPVLLNATTLDPANPDQAGQIERYEGMLVRLEDGTVVSPTNQFGEASIVAGSVRPFREPGILFPGLPGLPVWDGNPEIIEVDFDNGFGAAAPEKGLFGGMHINHVEGPLAYAFGDYQIWPTASSFPDVTDVVRPVRAANRGELTIGTQNFLRLYDTVDDPDVDDDVAAEDEYARRLQKASMYVRDVLRAPDILAVQEVENAGVLEDLAVRINADDSSIHYTAYLLEGNDIGGIDVGFLVRETVRVDRVEQFGKDDVFSFPGVDDTPLNDRPPLVLRGAYTGNGEAFAFVLVVVHQRSLSGIDGSSANAQRVRAKRFEQALRLSQFFQAEQSAAPGVRLIAVGDFNAFEFTDGYVDVMGQVTGSPDPAGALLPATDEIAPDLRNHTFDMPAGERYSFVFDGTAQSLDHVLTSAPLAAFVRGAEHSRANADAPFRLDVDLTTPMRTADHDGTVLFVMTDRDGDGEPDDQDKDSCKDGGWQLFTTPVFRNQGQCVSYMESNRPR